MNPDSALAFGLGWKLVYDFSNAERPELQVFVDEDVSRAGDWLTYGASAEATADQAMTVTFSGLGDTRALTIAGQTLDVRLETRGAIDVTYPRGSPEVEPVYGFVITRVGELGKSKRPSTS